MTEKPAYAPGCFGKVYCYTGDAVCGACPFAGQCEAAGKLRLAQLQELYGVETPTRKVASLPVKPKKMLEELGRTEQEVKDEMLAGRNPYRVSDGPVGIVAHLVLFAGCLTRERITQAMMAHRPDYNLKTAKVYTRYAIQILTHCGAVETDGRVVALVRG